MQYVAITEHGEVPIEVVDDGARVVVDGQVHEVDMQHIGSQSLFSLLVDNGSYEVLIEGRGEELRVLLAGKLYPVRVRSQERHRLASLVSPAPEPEGQADVRAPMPGLVVAVPVTAGQSVKAGDVLVIVESMKMENEIRASQDGIVQAVNVAAGEQVNGDQVMVVVQ
jgi:biotin carboxyl carrier protein